MKKVALLVVYNHRYDSNIPRVQELYKSRFSYIFHIVPFYDGHVDGAEVIPVYENSFYFEGYISQAYTHLRGRGFTHYFVIADDLILNPAIDENNLWDILHVGEDECFMPAKPVVLQKIGYYWRHIYKAVQYRIEQDGVEVKNVLPSRDEAIQSFVRHGLPTGPVAWKAIVNFDPRSWARTLLSIPWSRHLDYPLVACYSDCFMVTEQAMDSFCTYCGAFAATNLFVEFAIPTALILSADKLKFEDKLALKDGSMWPHTDNQWIEPLKYSLKALYEHFPKDKLFVHPIKLSKWS